MCGSIMSVLPLWMVVGTCGHTPPAVADSPGRAAVAVQFTACVLPTLTERHDAMVASVLVAGAAHKPAGFAAQAELLTKALLTGMHAKPSTRPMDAFHAPGFPCPAAQPAGEKKSRVRLVNTPGYAVL
jgi:hypothetical protein